METNKLTDQQKAALFDISFELGQHNFESVILNHLELCNITYKMSDFYLKELGKLSNKNEKQQMLEGFCNKSQALAIKSKQILNWNLVKMREEEIYSNLYEMEKRYRAEDLHNHRIEKQEFKKELEKQKQLNEDLIEELKNHK